MDELLFNASDKVRTPRTVPRPPVPTAPPQIKNFAVVYLVGATRAGRGAAGADRGVPQVDISKVPDFNKMYELYEPCTTMFFYRNKVRASVPTPRLAADRAPLRST